MSKNTNDPKMKHFPTFSQSPSPQAPWDPSKKMSLEISCNLDAVSSRLDQMTPHSCPFLVSNFDVFHKPCSLPPLPRKIHGRKDGKHHLPPVFLLNHLYPIFPPVPFVCIVWDKGQKASRHMRLQISGFRFQSSGVEVHTSEFRFRNSDVRIQN